jgi:hypothetical protein
MQSYVEVLNKWGLYLILNPLGRIQGGVKISVPYLALSNFAESSIIPRSATVMMFCSPFKACSLWLKKCPSMQLWLSGWTHDVPVHLRELRLMNSFETAKLRKSHLKKEHPYPFQCPHAGCDCNMAPLI